MSYRQASAVGDVCDVGRLDPRAVAALVALTTGSRRWLGRPADDLAQAHAVDGRWEDAELEAAATVALAQTSWPTVTARLDEADLLGEIVETVLGERVEEGYHAMLRESIETQLALRARDRAVTPAGTKDIRVGVVGAGVAGLAMALELERRGIHYEIFEAGDGVGGVWRVHDYPGCGVDTHPYIYGLETAPTGWRHYDPDRDEILAYLESVAERNSVTQRIRLGSRVSSAQYDESGGRWNMTIEGRDGTSVSACVDVLVSAVGSLSQPKIPDIRGLDDFGGPWFHTSLWRHDLDLSDKHVVLLGNGSSGVQVASYLAGAARSLTIVQRGPTWIAPRIAEAGPVPEAERWAMENHPLYAPLIRFRHIWNYGDKDFPSLVRDPQWSGPGISEANDEVRHLLTKYIRKELADDEDLIAALTPDHPPYAKRLVRDSGWYQAVRQDNVSVINGVIDHIASDRVVLADGTELNADVLVLATGFHGARFLWPMTLQGRDGVAPIAGGVDDVRAYLGCAIPGFPNFFSLHGPNSATAHGGSATQVAEFQAHYICEVIERLRDGTARTVEADARVCSEYNRAMDASLVHMVWSEPGISSRFLNSSGRVVACHPWTLLEFWRMTRQVDQEDFVWT